MSLDKDWDKTSFSGDEARNRMGNLPSYFSENFRRISVAEVQSGGSLGYMIELKPSGLPLRLPLMRETSVTISIGETAIERLDFVFGKSVRTHGRINIDIHLTGGFIRLTRTPYFGSNLIDSLLNLFNKTERISISM